MIIDIYSCAPLPIYRPRRGRLFVAVPHKRPIPDAVYTYCEVEKTPFKQLEIEVGKSRVALNPDQVIDDIQRDGFSWLGVEIQVVLM